MFRQVVLLIVFGIFLMTCTEDELLIPELVEDETQVDTMVISPPADTICSIDTMAVDVLGDTTIVTMDTIEIRVSNVSDYLFENITVQNHDQVNAYGNLEPGEFSEYRIFRYAWSIALIELYIDCEIYTIQPIDGLGSIGLTTGKYTYQVDANDSKYRYDKLEFSFFVD